VRDLEFYVVWHSYLIFLHFQMDNHGIPKPPMAKNPSNIQMGLPTCSIQDIQEDHVDTTEFGSDVSSDPEDDSNMLKMFEAYSAANSKQKGLYLRLFKIFPCTECTTKMQSS
jgi:hypothetical protein